MTSYLADQIAATGFAKVVVKVDSAGQGIEAVSDSAAELRAVADFHCAQRHFIVPRFGRDAALSRLTQTASGRHLASVAGRGTHTASSVAIAMPQSRVHIFPHLGLLIGTVDGAGLAALQSDGRVKEIAGTPELRLISPAATGRTRAIAAGNASANAAAAPTWGLEALGIPELWSTFKLSGKGVLIGHLDSGVDATHPAFAGAIASFTEIDAQGQPVPGSTAHDTQNHGTHTAGTIVGRPFQGQAFGCAPGAQLACAIVADSSGASSVERLVGGLEWLLSQNVRIVNLSVALGLGYQSDLEFAIRTLRDKNVVPVAAIGNDGPGVSRSPGNYDDVISIGACDNAGAVAPFSASQTFARSEDPLVPDLVAPGVDVLSAAPGGGVTKKSGTSQATPHVAGLTALLLEAVPGASANDLEAAIYGSCALRPKMTEERANRGLPNGPMALALLKQISGQKAAA